MHIRRNRKDNAPKESGGEIIESKPAIPVDRQDDEKRGSLFGKFNSAFQDAIETSRGADEPGASEEAAAAQRAAREQAERRSGDLDGKRMVVPEGVLIEGSLTSDSETEISGRIDGDVIVEGRLELGSAALITGNVKVEECHVDGTIEGKVECSRALELTTNGRIKADVIAGANFVLAGEVLGNIACGGKLHLMQTAKVNGSVRAHSLVVEEGAMFNGDCAMKPKTELKAAPEAQKEKTASAT